MKHDPLADTFYILHNTEKVGHESCIVPASDLIKNVLIVIQKAGYIGSFEVIEDGRGNKIRVDLVGRINKSQIIKPRFAVKKDEFEKWESRYLPAKGIGMIIVSTTKGIMTHEDAEKNELGGRLLGFVY